MISEDRLDYLTRLFQSRYGHVVAAARFYAPVCSDVDDIIQQVYLEFISCALEGNVRLNEDITPFLKHLAKRKAQILTRDRQKRNAQPLERVITGLSRLESSENPNGAHEVDAELNALSLCMEKLPAKSRSIIEQHYFEGVAMKEIARQQQKTETAVYRFFFRIRMKLRDCIEKSLIDDGL